MVERIKNSGIKIDSKLKILVKFGTKFLLLLIKGIRNLLRKSIKRSGECGEPYLTHSSGAVASLGFTGAVISVSHLDLQFSGSFPAGNCLNILCVFQVYSFVVGKLLRFLADLEGVKVMLHITRADLKKIDAYRRVDYACEKIWMLMVRAGFVVPLCIVHYVWQYEDVQRIKVELLFIAIFLVFQLLQIRYWYVLSKLHDMASMFEIHVFNAQNRLKKKWQSSVLFRIQSLLKSTYEEVSGLSSSHRELAVTYNFLVFSTLTTYTIASLGFDILLTYPFTGSTQVFQLIFILVAETDLRMMCSFKKSTLEKIMNIDDLLGKPTKEHKLTIPLRNVNLLTYLNTSQPLRNVLQIHFMKQCLVYSIIIGAAVHVISFYFNSQPVGEGSIKEFELPVTRIG